MLRNVETQEIASLMNHTDEQRQMLAGLTEERSAFNKHLDLLESQNLTLIDDLESHVRNGEVL